jgi:hypothetical protein
LAAHAHRTGAVHHGKEDHLTGHEAPDSPLSTRIGVAYTHNTSIRTGGPGMASKQWLTTPRARDCCTRLSTLASQGLSGRISIGRLASRCRSTAVPECPGVIKHDGAETRHLLAKMLDHSWSCDHIRSLAGPTPLTKPGAQLIGGRIGSTEDDVGVTRAVRKGVAQSFGVTWPVPVKQRTHNQGGFQ